MNTTDTQILKYLSKGARSAKDIYENVAEPRHALRNRIISLKRSGKIVSVRRGVYEISGDAGDRNAFFSTQTRTSVDNCATIDRLLNLYDEVLQAYASLMRAVMNSGQDLEKKEAFLKDFKNLTLIGDRLMKRWNLEHVGYDNNARQAQEDAKAKAKRVESENIENLPPEERVVVVGEYDTVMQELWDNLPEPEKEKRTI